MLPFIPYIPGCHPVHPHPLNRYLPPMPEGVITQWLEKNELSLDNKKGWILDPFGATPNISIEAAQAGYRVLVAANNPIGRFLIEMAAKQPSKSELMAVLAILAGTKKGTERLEPHIKSLYRTTCDQCNREVIANYFLWEKQPERENPELFARQYQCPQCGKKGEFHATTFDTEFASQFSTSGIHYARALERVSQKDDPYRQNAIEAFSAYLPRAVYALFTLINKTDGISISENQRRLLYALLLTTCDLGSTLWSYPSERSRPRQLMMPSRFRENNIWYALEQGVKIWAREENQTFEPIDINFWPDINFQKGGICIYEGRFKDLVDNIHELPVQMIISAIPRPNQPFWTLSALWSGWLWGREGVGPFKHVLRRRRYDWAWHRYAMQSTFESITKIMNPETPFLSIVSEVEPGFLTALFSAARNAELCLSAMAMRTETEQAQLLFHKFSALPTAKIPEYSQNYPLPLFVNSKEDFQQLLFKPAQEYLRQKGEPSAYLPLHAAILSYLSHNRIEQPLRRNNSKDSADLQTDPGLSSHEELSQMHQMVGQSLSYRNGFLRFGGSEKSLDVGSWWLREHNFPEAFNIHTPQADRVETALVKLLQNSSSLTIQAIDKTLCNEFPGLLTPSPELIQICLESYGEQDPPESGLWKLRAQDSAKKRQIELSEMDTLIRQVASSIGCQVSGQMPLVLADNQGNTQYIFYIIASGIVSNILLEQSQNPKKSLIILPGSRANLVIYKIHHDPRLHQAVEDGWRFLKYRQLRLLSKSAIISTTLLEEQLSKDLLTYNAPQLRLL